MSDGEFLWYAGALAAAGLLFLILAVLGVGQGVVLRVLDVLLGLAFLGYAGYLMVVVPDSPFMSWFVMVTPALGLAVAAVARRRSRVRLKRLEEELSTPPAYVGHDATGHAERQPFPSPPPPLDPAAPAPKRRKEPKSRAASTPMPSGLPPSGLGDKPVEAEPRPPRPSGLPQPHAEPRPPRSSELPQAHAEPRPPRPSEPPQPHAEPRPPRPSEAPQPHSEPRPPRWSEVPQPHAEPRYRARHGAGEDEIADHDYAGGRHRAEGIDRDGS